MNPKHYLLTIYQPDAPMPPPEVMQPIMRDVDAFIRDIKAAGAWVFNGGLHPPSTATVLRPQPVRQPGEAAELLVTDGPFIESKEHIGGFCIVRAPDLDAALAWGRRLARATTLPVEVRPFHDDRGDARDVAS